MSTNGYETWWGRTTASTTYVTSEYAAMPLYKEFDPPVSEDRMREVAEEVMGYTDAIVKCPGCGQWGAVKTPCRHCGAPIDPHR